MSSVNEILSRLHLSNRDLNNLSISQLETIFSNLTSKEISLLCRMSRKFNTLCKDESYWKNRVLNKYGIRKMYGSTWRETARRMEEFNMINLNIEWIDGRSYREILDDTLRDGADTLTDLPKRYLLPLINNDNDDANTFRYEMNDEKAIQNFSDEFLDRSYTED